MAKKHVPRVRVPRSAKAGEVVEIKTLISHDMESGQRKDSDGNTIPRKIINKFTCTFNGEEVFVADMHPAISANPYMTFFMKAEESGKFEFSWFDDDGSVYRDSAEMKVS